MMNVFSQVSTRPLPLARTGSVAVVVALVVALGGCAAAPEQQSNNAQTTPALQELKPLSEDTLLATLTASAQKNLVPGAIALVTTPAGSVLASYGTTSLGDTRQPKATDVFRIGSVTKTMVAAAILQQVGEGKLNLTDPISQFIDDVPNGESITIADLLQMRSGLKNYLDTDGFASVFNVDMTHVWTPQQLLEFGFEQPAVGEPDEAFDYSNTNTTLLGLVAEKLDEKPLRDILHDRLFEPLDMTHTELPQATVTTLPDPMVQGYQYGVFPINHQALLSTEDQAAAVAGTLKPNMVAIQSPSWSWAAGGAISTADDLTKWAQALGGSELLGADLHDEWLTDMGPMDPANPDDGPQYGLGIEQARFGANRLYLHEGELPGFNTFMAVDPALDVQIVIWTNLALSLDGQPTAKAVAGDVIGQLYTTPLGTPTLPTD